MAGWRQAVELAMTDNGVEALTALSRSRSEPASRVSRAQMPLAYRENPSFCPVGRRLGVHHQTVERCVERALAHGPLAALDDRPRPLDMIQIKETLVWCTADRCRDRPLVEGRRGHSRCAPSRPRHSPCRSGSAEARSENKTVNGERSQADQNR
jgi:hypothetical protein